MIPDESSDSTNRLSIGQCASMACLMEVGAPKVGNVNRSTDFADTSFHDFASSAIAIGPVFEKVADLSLGEIVYEAVRATRYVTDCNTNLGIILLFAPLAKAHCQGDIQTCLPDVLSNLTQVDCEQVYRAIQLAKPGGMGQVKEHDVSTEPDIDLLSAMEKAKHRDMIAQQYCNNFSEMFSVVVPGLLESINDTTNLPEAIVLLQIRLMSRFVDSLIARKCGPDIANQAQARAAAISQLDPSTEEYYRSLADFDFWLRSDSNRRNPGTTADLITAALFISLCQQTITAPFTFAD